MIKSKLTAEELSSKYKAPKGFHWGESNDLESDTDRHHMKFIPTNEEEASILRILLKVYEDNYKK